ncbi:MAG: ribulose-phosphate 3-epimerase [Ruminococcaceae bacterium]|nr:ribulose-phosphate 3-epimerase [Oscillospiraceae bacterium]
MKRKITPSIMCADVFNLEATVKEFEKNGIEYIHIDIMDGNFVPNYTLGTDFVKALKRKTKIPLDIHLMICNPEYKLDWFDFGEGDYVSVHYEATPHIHRAVSKIKSRGAKAMLAINPGTPFSVIENLLPDIDAVLVMTVNPGFAGQTLIKSTIEKIRNLREYLDKNGYSHMEIEVDGNVSFENACLMSKAGANIFVAGSSSVFSKEGNLDENIKKLSSVINTGI